jgi:ubiquinone biosynthesis protein
MNRLQLLRRLVSIQRVLVKYGLDELIGSSHLLRPARLLFRLSPSGWRGSQLDQPRGVRIRLAIEELGPIFVKFGQSLSHAAGSAARRHRPRTRACRTRCRRSR